MLGDEDQALAKNNQVLFHQYRQILGHLKIARWHVLVNQYQFF